MVYVIYLLKFFINMELYVKENENKFVFFFLWRNFKKIYILIDRYGYL